MFLIVFSLTWLVPLTAEKQQHHAFGNTSISALQYRVAKEAIAAARAGRLRDMSVKGVLEEYRELLESKPHAATNCRTRVAERPGTSASAPPFHFIHLPKTGGTAVQERLNEHITQHGLKACLLSYSSSSGHLKAHGSATQGGNGRTRCDPDKDSNSVLDGFGVFYGHHHWDMGHYDIRWRVRNPLRATVLRDPIAQAVSKYHYARSKPKGFLIEEQYGGFENVSEAVRFTCTSEEQVKAMRAAMPDGYGLHAAKFYPEQARWLCGATCASGPEAKRIDRDELEYQTTRLAIAQAHLLETDVVGVISGLESFSTELGRHLSWWPDNPRPLPHPHCLNCAPSGGTKKNYYQNLSRSDTECLRSVLAEDIGLYRLAQAIIQFRAEECEGERKATIAVP